jgi:uncharacterized protein YciI
VESLTMEEIRKRLAGVQLYAIMERDAGAPGQAAPPADPELLRRHLLYLIGLEEEGKLFAAGPLPGHPEGLVGMFIVAAASQEEADGIAESEPMHQAGRRRNTAHAWTLNEGVSAGLAKGMIAG